MQHKQINFNIKMILPKIMLLLIIFSIKEVSSECTATESEKITNCSTPFFNSFGIYQGDMETDGVKILADLMDSWENVENFCKQLDEFDECLGPSVIKNCMDLEKDLETVEDYVGLGYSFIHIGGNFVCKDGYDMLKNLYSCALSYCEIDNTTCQTTIISINQCSVVAKHKCKEESRMLLYPILSVRECFKNPDCEFCDPNLAEKIKIYRSKLNTGKNEKHLFLDDFTVAAQSHDFDLQFVAITKFHKFVAEGKLANDSIMKEKLLYSFVNFLSSKSPEVQAEAASAIKYLIDETPENFEVILESEIIPALIRTLILTNENVLEKVIEILATIISKQPSLRKTYMDSNILDPLLLSYSPSISKQMLDNMALILFYLPQENDISFNAKTREVVGEMIPALAALFYNYPRMIIVNFITDLLKLRFSQPIEKSINRNIVGSCFKLLSHHDFDIRISAFKILSIITKDKKFIQYFLDKGIPKIIKGAFDNDREENDWVSSYLGLKILTNIASGNANKIQAIFDEKSIPYLFKFLTHHDDTLQLGAILTLNKIIKNGSPQQISILIKMDLIKHFCQILQKLKYMDHDEIFLHPAVFDAINVILEKTADDKTVLAEFKNRGGVNSSIYILNTHENEEVRKWAVSILERLFK